MGGGICRYRRGWVCGVTGGGQVLSIRAGEDEPGRRPERRGGGKQGGDAKKVRDKKGDCVLFERADEEVPFLTRIGGGFVFCGFPAKLW